MKFRRRAFSGFEIACLDCTGRSFAKHTHDEFVIGANFSGREHIWLDGRNHEAERAQMTLYNPGQVQASAAGDSPWAFVSLYLEPAEMARLTGRSPEAVFDRPILWDEGLAQRTRTLVLDGLHGTTGDGEVTEAVTALVACLFDATGSGPSSRPVPVGPEVRRVADRLRSDMTAPPPLAELAAEEGLTPVQLVRAFTRAYGLPPFAWLTVERLKAARRAVAQGERLSQVAADLGFADQAHLTRRFKAMFGVPPGVWAAGG